MAQLKDTVVQGSLRATDTIYTSNLQVSTIKALSDSNSTSYGVGTNGQVLRSNASSTYWASLGTAADKQITDNSSNADVTSSDTNLITGRTLYYQLAQKGYTTNTGTVTSIQVQASSPLSSSSSSASSTTLNTTISFSNQTHNTVLAGPSATNVSNAAPTFRALVAADLPTATTSALGIMQVGTGLGVSSGTVSVSYGTSAGAALAVSGSAGTANTASRSDHIHPLPALTDCTGTLTVAKGGTGLTALGTAGTVLKVNNTGTGLEWGTVTGTGNGNAKIFYGTCSTDASISTKVVECAEFNASDLVAGCTISVKFTNKNAAASNTLKLQIHSNSTTTDAIDIRASYANLDNLQYIHDTTLATGSIITFIYNGKVWQLIGSINSVFKGAVVSESVQQADSTGSGAIITAGGMYVEKIARIGSDGANTPTVNTIGNSGLIVNGKAYIGNDTSVNGNASVSGTLTFTTLKLAGDQSSNAGKILKLKANGEFELGTISGGSNSTSGVAITTTSSSTYYLVGHINTSGATTTLYCRNSVKVNESGYLQATKVYGAVWNDYAEYRKTISHAIPGQVVIDNDDGSLSISTQRLQPGAQVISDTFGFAIGETEECKTPLAVSGRVLVYTYQPRENYHAGMAVCSAPNGTVDIMTREEIKNYPDAIIGIVSEIPNYLYWGTGNISVNNRIWIKIR